MSKMVGPRHIDPPKIAKYLLEPNHPQNTGKAKFFTHFGFSQEQPQILSNALDRHAEERDISEVIEDKRGVKTILRCNIKAPDGREPCILAVWIREKGAERQSFVTAYPDK